jgi:hypothetical protein
MKKVGFIVKNTKRVNGKQYEYFYLRRSDRLKVNNHTRKKIESNLYNFGNRKKTLDLLNSWNKDENKIPQVLIDLGYNSEDVKKWLEEVENR